MTKKELLERAKELEIEGRWNMSKEQLEAAIAERGAEDEEKDAEDMDDAELDEQLGEQEDAEDEELTDEEGVELMEQDAESEVTIDPEVVKDRKRRYPSERKRDSGGKVIRRGLRLNDNMPFKEKPYYLPRSYSNPDKWSLAYQTAVNAAPPQVRGIIKSMALGGVTSPQDALTGGEIVAKAKAMGLVVSKTSDRNLYAYYARVLATLGVKHAELSDEED